MSGVFRVDSSAYDDFMGRYSVPLAPLFADFAGVRDGQRVLDVGAGTGALTRELVARGAEVVAAEPSPEFTRALHARFPKIEVHEAPAEKLPLVDDSFDIALAQLVVTFMADAGAAMRELSRVARRVAICMWGVEEVEMFAAIEQTASVVGPSAGERRAPRYRKPQELRDLLLGAGLENVESSELDVDCVVRRLRRLLAGIERPGRPSRGMAAAPRQPPARARARRASPSARQPERRLPAARARVRRGRDAAVVNAISVLLGLRSARVAASTPAPAVNNRLGSLAPEADVRGDP